MVEAESTNKTTNGQAVDAVAPKALELGRSTQEHSGSHECGAGLSCLYLGDG